MMKESNKLVTQRLQSIEKMSSVARIAVTGLELTFFCIPYQGNSLVTNVHYILHMF